MLNKVREFGKKVVNDLKVEEGKNYNRNPVGYVIKRGLATLGIVFALYIVVSVVNSPTPSQPQSTVSQSVNVEPTPTVAPENTTEAVIIRNVREFLNDDEAMKGKTPEEQMRFFVHRSNVMSNLYQNYKGKDGRIGDMLMTAKIYCESQKDYISATTLKDKVENELTVGQNWEYMLDTVYNVAKDYNVKID